ncbi:AbiH family protein [Ekhidna sp.]
MNRLIILGNGFDLAHGLPTKYSDFLLYYLKKAISEVRQTRTKYRDPLINLNYPLGHLTKDDFNSYRTLVDSLLETGSPLSSYTPLTINKKGFLHKILSKGSLSKWQNLELLYHDFIINLLDSLKSKKITDKTANTRLKEFHKSLEFFLQEFKLYLEQVVSPMIDKTESIEAFKKEFDSKEKLIFLNFNYTQTVRKYIKFEEAYIINIHGLADSIESEICFGFGDEHSPRYDEIENLYENEFLKYSKSMFYSRDETYRHLLGLLSQKFKVDIFGHSCGITDRTLLKQIFEDEHCVGIHYHYYSSRKDHREKYIELSRHFEDKKRLRKIVRPAESSTPCPQLS